MTLLRRTRIHRLVITLDDGSEEVWDFAPQNSGLYVETRNAYAHPYSGESTARFHDHRITWTSDMEGSPPIVPSDMAIPAPYPVGVLEAGESGVDDSVPT